MDFGLDQVYGWLSVAVAMLGIMVTGKHVAYYFPLRTRSALANRLMWVFAADCLVYLVALWFYGTLIAGIPQDVRVASGYPMWILATAINVSASAHFFNLYRRIGGRDCEEEEG